MVDGIIHKVHPGECFSLIAEHYGHNWKKLWDHSSNLGLREKRKNPNVLFEGDEVFVPAKETREVPAGTEQRHRFLRKNTPSKFTLRLMMFGKPRAGLPYVFLVDGKIMDGHTDGEGYIRVPLPIGAKSAT